jgi:hypothetical protein
MPSARPIEAKAPVELGLVSVMVHNLREIRDQLDAYATAALPRDRAEVPVGQGERTVPAELDLVDGYRRLGEQYRVTSAEMAQATDELMREHAGRMYCEIAVRTGTPPRYCPRLHLHASGKLPAHKKQALPDGGPAEPNYIGHQLQAKTLIPAHLIGGADGEGVCVDPSCYLDGEPRRFRYLGDLLPENRDVVLTGEELAVLFGMKYKTLMSYIKEADLPVVDQVYTGANPKNRYRMSAALQIPRVARRLAGPAF